MALKLYTVGDVTVTTAGTRVQLTSTNTYVSNVTVQGLGANTGKIFVGDSSVSATRGYELSPGSGIAITSIVTPKGTQELVNLADIWFDAASNGDKVHVVYQDQVV